MMRARREKVFGPGRTVPLNRNAKAHSGPREGLERQEQAAPPTQEADHQDIPGGAAVGLSQ
jgi:hypothetical protein